MKKLLLLIFVLGFTFSPAQSKEAKSLLDQSTALYKKSSTFYIKYQYKAVNVKVGLNTRSTGEVYARGSRYNLTLLDTQQIYDGEKLYTISKDEKEVVVSRPNANGNDLLTPMALLNAYKEGYVFSMAGVGIVNGKKVQYIKLQPEVKGALSHIIVAIDKQTKALVEIKEINRGTTVTLTVKEYVKDLILPSNIFTFSENNYSNYVITDID